MTPRSAKLARAIAIAADVVQLGLFPLFGEGFTSPLNDALDVVVGIAMVRLLGWHTVFLPTFAVELLPIGDLAPTWTVAYWLATRSRRGEVAEISPPESRPSGRPLPPVAPGRSSRAVTRPE